jgi:hypothetical protein
MVTLAGKQGSLRESVGVVSQEVFFSYQLHKYIFITLALRRLLFYGCVPDNYAEQEVRVYLTVTGLQESNKLSEGMA